MRKLQRAAILLALAEELKAAGSWCGETHIQKATYFLEALVRVPLEYRFILYKHGPYSFDLRDEITSMLADNLFELRLQLPSYGPSILPSESGKRVKNRFSKTVSEFSQQVELVASWLGNKSAAELERLATALYITREDLPSSVESRARRLNELKPHVSIQEGIEAVDKVDELVNQSRRIVSSSALS